MAGPRSIAPADFKRLDDHFDELKNARLPREQEWQMIADVFLPRKDFTLPQRPTELRKRRLTSSVPAIALRRGAGLLSAYLVSHTQPFIKPNVSRGLVAAGRSTDLDAASRDYLSRVEWAVFDRMILPQSGYLTSLARLNMELFAFGSGVMWTGRQRGFGPRYQTRPLRACWFSENEEGQVDTLFYQFTLPLWRAVERWPNHGVDDWTRAMADENAAKRRELVTIVHGVYPRRGGRPGAEGRAKPFAEVFVCRDKKAILQEGGYDSFPFAVPRLDVEDGSAYGTGLAWWVLPEAMVLNALQQGVENAVELRNNPPLLMPQRLFAKPLDRRGGAANYYDASKLGFQNAPDAVMKLDIAGDVSVAATYLARLEQNVEQAFFTDWMRLRESGNMTAEEVRERRDLRLRGMSAFVPGVDRDLMGVTADRTLEVMDAEAQLERPPAQLSAVDVDWDYSGPLAIAQLKAQADGVLQTFEAALRAKDLDPSAPYVLAVEEGLRTVAEAYALGPEQTRSREEVAALRERDAQAQRLAQDAELANQAAQALQAGGQGIAALQGAGGGQQRMAA